MKGREREMAIVGSFLPGRQGSAPQVWKELCTLRKSLQSNWKLACWL